MSESPTATAILRIARILQGLVGDVALVKEAVTQADGLRSDVRAIRTDVRDQKGLTAQLQKDVAAVQNWKDSIAHLRKDVAVVRNQEDSIAHLQKDVAALRGLLQTVIDGHRVIHDRLDDALAQTCEEKKAAPGTCCAEATVESGDEALDALRVEVATLTATSTIVSADVVNALYQRMQGIKENWLDDDCNGSAEDPLCDIERQLRKWAEAHVMPSPTVPDVNNGTFRCPPPWR